MRATWTVGPDLTISGQFSQGRQGLEGQANVQTASVFATWAPGPYAQASLAHRRIRSSDPAIPGLSQRSEAWSAILLYQLDRDTALQATLDLFQGRGASPLRSREATVDVRTRF